MSESLASFEPNSPDELIQFVADNATHTQRRLLPVGGGTACRNSVEPNVVEVRLSKLNRVIDYPARDMTITVEAGIRMAELARILAAENQRLPIDVPQPEQATLGGVIATNWSGSQRFGCGTMRDYVIGISAIDASGRRFSAGGRVVKNVAGYDLCKLLVGSMGELAIITQVTLKLRPMPETSALVRLTFDSLSQIDAVLNRILTSATRPVVLDVMSSTSGNNTSHLMLVVGYEGAERETNWQVETLLSESRPFEPREAVSLFDMEAETGWNALRDFAVITAVPATFKASLPASRTCELLRLAREAGIPTQAHAGNGVVIGHVPRNVTSNVQAESVLRPLADLATASGGSLVVLRCPADWPLARSFGGSDDGRRWSERIQRRLDPLGLFRS
jgi:glycolate oxidase FAD binding subunit